MPRPESKSISLVLGSGGARGLAHIGVIRVLEQAGYEIRSLAGSSMGALIAGFHAAGKLDAYENWVRELTEFTVLRYLDISLGKAGMIKGDVLMETLKDFIGEHRIEDLPIPLTAVATDINSGKEVWLNRGSLFDAIRASIAVPTVFTPHKIWGRYLLDGGILNPVPIAPTLEDETDLIVAVSLSGEPTRQPRETGSDEASGTGRHQSYQQTIEQFIDALQERLGLEQKPEEDELSLSEVVLKSIDTMQASIARCKLAAYPPDLLIEVPINTCQAHEFYRAGEVIAAGEYWAEQALARFQWPRNGGD